MNASLFFKYGWHQHRISMFPFVKADVCLTMKKSVSDQYGTLSKRYLSLLWESCLFLISNRSLISREHSQKGNWHFLRCEFFAQPLQTSCSHQSPERRKSRKMLIWFDRKFNYIINHTSIRSRYVQFITILTCIFPHSIMFLSCN